MANDPSTPSADKVPSRQSAKRTRRTAQAAASSSSQPADSQPVPTSIEQTHALVVSSRRKRYTDNRPVDPSPIEVSQTVRMAGMRPIGASPNIPGSPRSDFTQSPQIMNRPIAPNTSAEDEEMLGYLD